MAEEEKRKEFLDSLAKLLGIPEDEQKILDAGASHPHECKCETCERYWDLIGREE